MFTHMCISMTYNCGLSWPIGVTRVMNIVCYVNPTVKYLHVVFIRQQECETAGTEGARQLRPSAGRGRSASGGEDPAGQGSGAPHGAVQVGHSSRLQWTKYWSILSQLFLRLIFLYYAIF